jgi:hypothetical protein
MSDVPLDVRSAADRDLSGRKRILRALIWKEWIEHRWRFLLAVILLSTLLGGMLRAQVIPYNEAAIAVYWPAGTLLALFLAMAPIPQEKSGRTWEFLLAQPVPRFEILLAKWRMGLIQLVATCLTAGGVGLVAMWSRNFYGSVTIWEHEPGGTQFLEHWLELVSQHPGLWLIVIMIVASISLCCWYTFLFFALIGARNEFEAALGGVLLTGAAHAWLAQIGVGPQSLRALAGLNPFATFIALIYPVHQAWLLLMLPVHLSLWIGGPLLLARRFSRRVSRA